MKKYLLINLFCFALFGSSFSQTPAITMTTALPVGSDFYFILEGKNTQIQVDFGDGVLVNKVISTSLFTGWGEYSSAPMENVISGKLVGSQIVKVYGTGITGLTCKATALYLDFLSVIKTLDFNDLLTNLDVSNCPELRWLECNSSQLTSLDISKNTALSLFNCSLNKFESLDISHNTNMTLLWCFGNKLTSLDLRNNVILTELSCYSNQLTTLDVSKNSALTRLICDYNKLTDLKVSNNVALTNLTCSNNYFTSLDVSKNTLLKMLRLSNNLLTELDLSLNNNLQDIECGGNLLKSLDISKDTALLKLECAGNQLTNLDITKNTKLGSLTCRHNQLSSLDVSKNKALYEIYCQNNLLTTLDLSTNTLMYMFDCSANKLKSLDLSNLTKLHELYCQENQLTDLNLSANAGLSMVYCYSNQLTSLDLSTLTDLNLVLCYSNQLTFATIPIIPLPAFLIYAPQNPVFVDKALITGKEIDLSSQLIAKGNTTVYTWKTQNGYTLVPGTDYTLTNGKTIFMKAQTDSVYCEMTNATFPQFTADITGNNTLKTTCTKVSVTTELDDNRNYDIQIYVRNKAVCINSPTSGQVSVYDISGRLVATKEITEGDNTINLLKSGIYLTRFTGNRSPVTKKIFIGN